MVRGRSVGALILPHADSQDATGAFFVARVPPDLVKEALALLLGLALLELALLLTRYAYSNDGSPVGGIVIGGIHRPCSTLLLAAEARVVEVGEFAAARPAFAVHEKHPAETSALLRLGP
jgi:hypothetical protein